MIDIGRKPLNTERNQNLNDMKELKSCAMYICNGLAVSLADSGEFPTVEDLRSNWQAYKYAILTDEEIQHMLNLLKRYY